MIELLINRVKDSSDEVFFQTIDNQNITYSQFFSFAYSIVNDWKKDGLKTGDRIVLKINNSLSLLASYLACAIGGYTAVPISPTMQKEDFDLILSQTKPTTIIDNPPLFKNHHNVFNKDEIEINSDPNLIFCIMFSSGTTGTPKGICLRLGRTIGSAQAFGKLSGFDQNTVLYHILPMYYMAGLMNAFLAPFITGARIIEGPEFSLGNMKTFWERPVKMKANAIVLFPIIASALCRLARNTVIAKANAENFKLFQCTGNLLSEGLRKKFLDIFDKPLQDCYGITEVGGGLSMQTTHDAMLEHNSGRMINELDHILVDYFGKNKELWIRSPFMMAGYLVNNKVTLHVDGNGYFNTGDFAEIMDNKLRITGRSKDIIIRGAVNISPSTIENEIKKINGVEDVFVLGLPHESWGEMVVACIVTSGDQSSADLINIINNSISSVLSPEHLPNKIVVVDGFPRSISGTVQKKLLIEMIINK